MLEIVEIVDIREFLLSSHTGSKAFFNAAKYQLALMRPLLPRAARLIRSTGPGMPSVVAINISLRALSVGLTPLATFREREPKKITRCVKAKSSKALSVSFSTPRQGKPLQV